MKNLKLTRVMYPWAILNILLMLAIQANGQSKDNQKLFDACQIGDIKKVEKLISKGANVNCYTAYHETPLMIAIDRKNNELATLLLSKGANPALKSDCFFIEFQNKRKDGTYEIRVGKKQDGENALILAIENGNEEIFNLLIKQAIDINFEYQPSIQVGNYSLSQLYSAPDALNSMAANINFNGVHISWSETSFKGRVCIVNSKPTEPMKYTPFKVAILAKNKNYFIIEKLAELSSHELNNDLVKMTEFINDSKTIEILKKYKFIN